MRDDNEPRDAPRLAMTNDPDDAHRLAVIAFGNNGSQGNHTMDFDLDDPEVMQELADRLCAEADRAWERADALAELRDAEIRSAVAARQERRAEASYERHAERERRRAEGTLYAEQRRRPNRPTHVEVEDGAWRVVKRHTVERGGLVGYVVAELVTAAVTKGLPARAVARERGHRPIGRRAGRYARLFIDDQTWSAFRAVAVDAAVSTARAVGLVIEAEARRLGWSPTDGHR